MKKNDIFTFTAPNGVEVTAVVVTEINHKFNNATQEEKNTYLCYAQNRLFTINAVYTPTSINEEYGEIIVDYAILPDYDELLEAEQQKFEDDCYEALSSIGDVEF